MQLWQVFRCQHIICPYFDPNEWWMKNGIHSRNSNSRPLGSESSALITRQRLLTQNKCWFCLLMFVYLISINTFFSLVKINVQFTFLCWVSILAWPPPSKALALWSVIRWRTRRVCVASWMELQKRWKTKHKLITINGSLNRVYSALF